MIIGGLVVHEHVSARFRMVPNVVPPHGLLRSAWSSQSTNLLYVSKLWWFCSPSRKSGGGVVASQSARCGRTVPSNRSTKRSEEEVPHPRNRHHTARFSNSFATLFFSMRALLDCELFHQTTRTRTLLAQLKGTQNMGQCYATQLIHEIMTGQEVTLCG